MTDALMDRIKAHRMAPDVYDPPTFDQMADRMEGMMADLIKRDDALALVEQWFDTDNHLYSIILNDITNLPAVDPVINDPAAIREAALREAADVAQRGADISDVMMRDAKNRNDKRAWQSMLYAAVDIKHAILALIGEKK